LWFIAIDDLEVTYRLFDRHCGEVQQRLNRASDLLVLLEDAPEGLLDSSLLVVGVIIELHHLLLQSVKTGSKVINILTWLEGQVLPLLAKCLQRGLAGAVDADACRSDGVPSLLGSPLLRKRDLHLRRDCSNEGIQRPLILIVIDVAIPNCFPHVLHLEPYLYHRGSLNVVGLGEGRPPAAGTDIPNNGLDPMVTMVPVRGGRAASPVKAAISVNPAADASASVWAAAAVWGTASMHAPARSTAGVSAPIRAAATMPLGVRDCLLRHLLLRCLPRQLKLVVSVIVGRNRATSATGAQSLELYHRRSLVFLCCGNLSLLPVLRARGDRTLRLSF
jgi:hypothetical protein